MVSARGQADLSVLRASWKSEIWTVTPPAQSISLKSDGLLDAPHAKIPSMKVRPAILITGCSSGIGLAVAKGLAARNWRVFATARHQQDVDVLNAMGLESLVLDLDDSASVQAGATEVLVRVGGAWMPCSTMAASARWGRWRI